MSDFSEAPVERRLQPVLTDEQANTLLIAAAVVRAEKSRIEKWQWPHMREDVLTAAVDALHRAKEAGPTPAWDAQSWEPCLGVKCTVGGGAEIVLMEHGDGRVYLTAKYTCSAVTCALDEAAVARVIAWMSGWLQRTSLSVRSGG